MHQETARAGELIGLLGHHPDREFLARQVSAGQLEVLGRVGFIDINDGGLRLVASCFQFLQRVLGNLVSLRTPRGVVIGSHGHPLRYLAAELCTSVERIYQMIRAQKARRLYVICITYASDGW